MPQQECNVDSELQLRFYNCLEIAKRSYYEENEIIYNYDDRINAFGVLQLITGHVTNVVTSDGPIGYWSQKDLEKDLVLWELWYEKNKCSFTLAMANDTILKYRDPMPDYSDPLIQERTRAKSREADRPYALVYDSLWHLKHRLRWPYLPVKEDTIPKEVFGSRFSISGDYNGDGKPDTLTEQFISRHTGRETNKYYERLDMDSMTALLVRKSPVSRMVSTDTSLTDLFISDQELQFGLAFAKNEGDLDGNGTDELSYVVEWADWSSMNTCVIVTWTPEGWKRMASFEVRDWQLPTYRLAERYRFAFHGPDHLQVILKRFDFKGLITPGPRGTVTVQTFDEYGESKEKQLSVAD